jgi:hypothetical protein
MFMATNFRTTKLLRYVKRLEARIPVVEEKKAEALKEVVAEIRHEFNLKEEKG